MNGIELLAFAFEELTQTKPIDSQNQTTTANFIHEPLYSELLCSPELVEHNENKLSSQREKIRNAWIMADKINSVDVENLLDIDPDHIRDTETQYKFWQKKFASFVEKEEHLMGFEDYNDYNIAGMIKVVAEIYDKKPHAKKALLASLNDKMRTFVPVARPNFHQHKHMWPLTLRAILVSKIKNNKTSFNIILL